MELYEQGYQDALNEYNKVLNASIRRHGGCKTFEQAWNVVSDLILFSHKQAPRTQDVLNEVHKTITITIGGIN